MENFKKMWLFIYEKFQKKCGYSCMKNFKNMWLFIYEKCPKMWLFQYEKFPKNVVILV